MTSVSASMLYALVHCPHRVWLDAFGVPADRDPSSSFAELLWERGTLLEKDVIRGLNVPFTDLSDRQGTDKERATLAAMAQGDALIYAGRITSADLVGEPDLLRRRDGGYEAIDIKSGAGLQGADEENDKEGKPKKHYAVQLALYTDILARLDRSAGRTAYVWDVRRQEVPYDLDAALGVRSRQTYWQFYEDTLAEARAILAGSRTTTPATASVCKQCHWQTSCAAAVHRDDDLTQIAELGRSRRDSLAPRLPTVQSLADADIQSFMTSKGTVFRGVGADMLEKFQRRARLLKTPGAPPSLLGPTGLPPAGQELHFDIEADPLRDHVYMHGFVVRDIPGGSLRYCPFIARQPTPSEERTAFAEAMAFIRAHSSAAIYVYSSYERTAYRRLQKRHGGIATDEEIEVLFRDRVTDLYQTVRRATEWPTNDLSIKTLAKFLGFRWRDTQPSGAGSIEWYDDFLKSGDERHLSRLLDYNEDDCGAMVALVDGLRAMEHPQ